MRAMVMPMMCCALLSLPQQLTSAVHATSSFIIFQKKNSAHTPSLPSLLSKFAVVAAVAVVHVDYLFFAKIGDGGTVPPAFTS